LVNLSVRASAVVAWDIVLPPASQCSISTVPRCHQTVSLVRRKQLLRPTWSQAPPPPLLLLPRPLLQRLPRTQLSFRFSLR
jgi:hypothetical protein